MLPLAAWPNIHRYRLEFEIRRCRQKSCRESCQWRIPVDKVVYEPRSMSNANLSQARSVAKVIVDPALSTFDDAQLCQMKGDSVWRMVAIFRIESERPNRRKVHGQTGLSNARIIASHFETRAHTWQYCVSLSWPPFGGCLTISLSFWQKSYESSSQTGAACWRLGPSDV